MVSWNLRRIFVLIVLGACVAAPLAGMLHDIGSAMPSEQLASAETADIDAVLAAASDPLPSFFSLFVKQRPAIDEAQLPAGASGEALCKCCMTGKAPAQTAPPNGHYAGSPAEKSGGGTVQQFLNKVLRDERQLLTAKEAALRRWSVSDRAYFATWFGTSSPQARAVVHQRINAVLQINQQYKPENFRAASPSVAGVFAYVFASDTSKIYLDKEFFRAKSLERAGTLVHEMTHFLGTKDHAYGPEACKNLARRTPALAIQNADNYEFFVQGGR
jgi:Lysine-specific metallo-endopeptidase